MRRRWVLLLFLLLLGLLAVGGWARWGALPPNRWDLYLNGELVAEGEALEGATDSLRARLDGAAHVVLTLTADGRRWQFTRGALGLPAAPPDLAERIATAAAVVPRWHRWLRIRPAIHLTMPLEPDAERLGRVLTPLREALEWPARSASLQVKGGRPILTREQLGRHLDEAALARLIWGPPDSPTDLPRRPEAGQAEIVVPFTEEQPAVRTADLVPLIEGGPIATWSTFYDPAIPRAENVERAAAALNGNFLHPGQILSYNGQVGPVSTEGGWREAPVFAGGRILTGVGGGLCQVATTLYGAALRANLTILERHPHQLAVSYIPLGEDAAVTPGYQDLKIQNQLAGPVLITAQASGGRVTFQVWGAQPTGVTIRIESRTTGLIPYQIEERPDPALPHGSRVLQTAGRPGYTAEAYRLLYQDGQFQKRELLSRDRYEPVTELIRVGI
jgi:vancomycin resistance protein YoaR